MILAAVLQRNAVGGSSIYNTIFMIFGLLCEIAVVSIELMTFHLETIKFKFITFVYYVVELLLAMWINSMIPFAGLVVVTTFSVLKNVYRVLSVEKIYMPLGYYELCKKFGIKVKKPTTRRKKTTTTKKRVAVVATKSKAKAKSKTKRGKAVDTSTSKSYA